MLAVTVIAGLSLLASQPFGEKLTADIVRRVREADPAVSLGRFLDYTRNAPHDRFVANPRFWLKGVDFSCVSPWNSACGGQRAGTAISKRHIVFAKHFPLWKDVRLVFADDAGGVCPCSIKATKEVPHTDIMVGLLNAELTPNIKPAKILPSDAARYLGDGRGLPVVTFDRWENVHIAALGAVPTNSTDCLMRSFRPPEELVGFSARATGGDSGNPAFLIIDNEPVLLYCLYQGNFGAGHSLRFYQREIQKAMDELCPGYKLEEFDFEKLRRDDGK